MKINKVSPRNHPYLETVTAIAKPPETLHFLGSLPSERRPTIAVVGTRKPTSYGKEVTERLASELARQGIVVVSGLALGVDGIAHRAAVQAGGTTIAVLANSLPDVRPAANRDIAEKILLSGGAIMSEHVGDDYVVGKWSFLDRNRLVSGISDAVLITEASVRSGSLNTAMHALEQGKDVFVVPGNITSPNSTGCNLLLRQGATLVTCAEDILEVLAPQLLKEQSQLAIGSNTAETAIIEQLKLGKRDGEEIQRITGIDAAEFNTALTMLEIQGIIKSLGANQWIFR